VRICGKRPPSNVFIELRHELEKYDRAHTLAKSSNESLREAVDTRVKNLRILMKPLAELARHIPSPQAIGMDQETDHVLQTGSLIYNSF